MVGKIRKTFQKNKKQVFYILFGGVVLFLSAFHIINASPYKPSNDVNKPSFVRAKVLSSTIHTYSESGIEQGGGATADQEVVVRLIDGPDQGMATTVQRVVFPNDINSTRLPGGSTVLLSLYGDKHSFVSRYHVPGLVLLGVFVLVLVLVVGGFRGMTSLVGLVTSIGILSVFVVPRIITGHDAFLACIQGAFMIAFVSIFIAHGFNRRTTVAFMSTVLVLGLVVGFVSLASYFIGFTGYSGETAYGLQNSGNPISAYGLLAGGLIIAVLGVLDDITTGQSAVVDELHKLNPKLGIRDLYKRSMSVGKEHVASLINTLALVYVGVALPTVVVSSIYYNGPLVVLINNGFIAEEILRILVTSVGLLLAVPLTTLMAVYVLPRWYRVGLFR